MWQRMKISGRKTYCLEEGGSAINLQRNKEQHNLKSNAENLH